MKIGIIGAGNIGGNLTRRLTALGHDVSVANSRGPQTLTELAEETGVSTLDVAAKMRRQAQSVARTFVELVLEVVWKPFDDAGRPEERWPEVVESLERLRPLASEALLATFQLVMTEVTEEAFGRELRRESRGSEGRSRRRTRRR